MLILESQRGGARQDFDFPALEKGRVLDITSYVALTFSNAVGKILNSSIETRLSDKVTEDSKLFTLDRRFPRELVPDVAKCVRDNEMTKELSSFIRQVINVQARNVIEIAQAQKGDVLEFQPGDSLLAAGKTALPIYAYIRRDGEFGLVLETETAFRVYNQEPKVEAQAAEPTQE